MLRFRPEQMAVFAALAREQFRARAIEHVRRCWSGQAAQLGPERLPLYVDAAIAEAEARGLTAERDVLLHIDTRILLGSHPEYSLHTPWVAALWSRSDLSPPTRLRLLWRRLATDVRAHAALGAAADLNEQAP